MNEPPSQSTASPPSTVHSNWLPPSDEVKVKSPVSSWVARSGFVPIVVSGAAVSIVQREDSGVASAFVAGSTARTSTVCEPSSRSR